LLCFLPHFFPVLAADAFGASTFFVVSTFFGSTLAGAVFFGSTFLVSLVAVGAVLAPLLLSSFFTGSDLITGSSVACFALFLACHF